MASSPALLLVQIGCDVFPLAIDDVLPILAAVEQMPISDPVRRADWANRVHEKWNRQQGIVTKRLGYDPREQR